MIKCTVDPVLRTCKGVNVSLEKFSFHDKMLLLPIQVVTMHIGQGRLKIACRLQEKISQSKSLKHTSYTGQWRKYPVTHREDSIQ